MEDIEKSSPYGGATEEGVFRKLKARHVQMIALGGSIGTGLFIGTGSALSLAGPAGSLISFIIAGSYVYAVLQAIGEMASYIPVTGSYTQFVSRFLHPSIGFSANWLNVMNISLACAIEINATVMVISYWTTSISGAVYMSLAWLFIVAVNSFPVSIYGEVEYALTYVKVLTILGWLILALLITSGISPQGPIGFKFWSDPGAWGPGYGVTSNLAADQFVAFLSVFILATYTYQGSELVGITAGEAENPRKTIPRAIKMVFFRLALFYIGTMFFIGLTVPYNDPSLLNGSSPTSTSPLVIAVVNAGISVLPDILNAVILITVISAGASQFYSSSRVLLAMAKVNAAPKFFLKTSKTGIPYYSCMLVAGIAALAFLNLSAGAATVFNWLVNLVSVAGLVIWCSICFAHLRFRKALKVQGLGLEVLPYTSPFQPYLSWYGFVITGFLAFFQGFTVFFSFDVSKFFAAYLSVLVFFILYLGHWAWTKSSMVSHENMDLVTGKKEADAQEWDDDDEKSKPWYKRALRYIV